MVRRQEPSPEKRATSNRTGDKPGKGKSTGSKVTQFQPGNNANPKGRPKGSTVRENVARNFLLLLEKPFPTNNHTYSEELLRKILVSERLIEVLLNKMLPTLTPEQTNVIMQNFETRILAMQAGRVEQVPMIAGSGVPVPPTIELSAVEESGR